MAKSPRTSVPARYRVAVVSRLLAATLGGYTLTALLVSCVAQCLTMARAESVLAASLPAFLIFTATILWAFAARSASKAWLGLIAPCLALAACLFWLRGNGA